MGIFNKDVTTRANKLVTFASFPESEAESKMPGLKKESVDVDDFTGTFQLKLYNGIESQNAKGDVTYNAPGIANIVANAAKYSAEVGPEYIPAGRDIPYTGSCSNGMPMEFERVQDPSDNTSSNITVNVRGDLKAIASANYEEKMAKYNADQALDESKRRGIPAPNAADKERITATFVYNNTNNGVAGVSADTMAGNIGKFAAQRYLLTASKKDPAQGLATPDDISRVGKLVNDTFMKTLQASINGDCEKNMKSTGKGKSGKSEIAGTAVAKPAFGIQIAEVNGAQVISIDPNANKKDVNDFFKAVSTRTNRTLAQEIGTLSDKAGSGFQQGSMANKLANEISVEAYPVSPKIDGANGLSVVQVSMRATTKPYAASLTKANEVYRHKATPEEAYGKEILDNLKSLNDTYQKESKTAEEAKRAAEKQVADIKAACATFEKSGPSMG
jgi:hypothetical protein